MERSGLVLRCSAEVQIYKNFIEITTCPEKDSSSWKYFQFARQVRLDSSPNCPTIPLLNYVNDNAEHAFDDAELQVWLFLVMLEHESLLEGSKLGFSEVLLRGIDASYEFRKAKNHEGLSSYKGLIPIDTWVPKADGPDKLSTTRYRVMHHMLQNHSPKEKKTRKFMFLHGNEFLTLKPGDNERGIAMKTALDAFHNKKHGHRGKIFFCVCSDQQRCSKCYNLYLIV